VADGETPVPGECTAATPPQPTPTEGGLDPKPYPPYPEPLTADTADDFARTYEYVYQYNLLLAEGPGYDEIDVSVRSPDWATFDTEPGFIVGVTGEIQFADTNTATPPSTQLPYGTSPVSAWYYLTDRFALRDEYRSGSLEKDDYPYDWTIREATTIVCTERESSSTG
jgi:hypothetical protein